MFQDIYKIFMNATMMKKVHAYESEQSKVYVEDLDQGKGRKKCCN